MSRLVRTRNACRQRSSAQHSVNNKGDLPIVTVSPEISEQQAELKADLELTKRTETKKKIVSEILQVLKNEEDGIQEKALFSIVHRRLKEAGFEVRRVLRELIHKIIRANFAEWVQEKIKLKKHWIEMAMRNFEYFCSTVMFGLPTNPDETDYVPA